MRVSDDSDDSDGWQLRRRRISRALEHTALQLFAEKGYPNVTLNDVAAAAGISPRTLTRYFPLKEDLLLSQPRRAAAAAQSALAQAPSGRDAVASLWDMWIGMAAQAEPADLDDLRLWHRAAQTAPGALARGGAEMSGLIGTSLTKVAAETLDVALDDLQARVLAAALTAALDSVLQQWLEDGGRQDLEELFIAAREALANGFRSARLHPVVRR